MIKYLFKRFGSSLFTIWGVLTICFLILHLAPGNPASIYIRPEINSEVVDNIRHQMGFDLPVWKQYFLWIKEFVFGNFGHSFSHHKPVSDVLLEAIPNTLQLTLIVLIVQYIIGIFIGTLMAVKKNKKVNISLNTTLLFLYSMPGFWLSLIAILIFSLKLGWLPPSQMSSLIDVGGVFAGRRSEPGLQLVYCDCRVRCRIGRYRVGNRGDHCIDTVLPALAGGDCRRHGRYHEVRTHAQSPGKNRRGADG